MRTIIIAAALGIFAMPALAAQQCEGGLDEVNQMIAETPMPPNKEMQVKALLDQVVRACKENNEVVAQAGLDQVKAMIQEQKKAG
jgi:hypothetical protein